MRFSDEFQDLQSLSLSREPIKIVLMEHLSYRLIEIKAFRKDSLNLKSAAMAVIFMA